MNKDTFVGIDLGGTFVKSALVDRDGHLVSKHSVATNAGAGVDVVMERISEAVQKVMTDEVRGIGIGAPGLVDAGAGEVFDLTNFKGWQHVPLASKLTAIFKRPAFVDNDGNVMALAECLWGAGKGANSLLGLTLGTGVGGGLVIGQKPYQTHGLSAVEFGHIVIQHDGLPCACGGRGCLERYVGNQFIVERFLKRVDAGEKTSVMERVKGQRQEITPAILSAAADHGDALSMAIWTETGQFIGSSLVTAVNLLAPEVIAIGGGVAQAGEKLFKPMRDWVSQYAMSALAKGMRIVPAELGNDAGVIGAACLAMQSLAP